eukprot:7852495-Karenia_brevis.AAC.1
MMRDREYQGKCKVAGCQHYTVHTTILRENGMEIFRWKCWFHAPCVGPEQDAKTCPKSCHYPMNNSSAVATAVSLGTLDVFRLMAQNMGHGQ